MSRGQRRTWAGALLVMLTLSALGACDDRGVTTSSGTNSATSAPPAAAYAPAPVQAAAPVAESGTVVEVIDGDTFRLAGGDEVRVLGIDSCEMSTDRGQEAKDAAELWLASSTVTLEREPGVDRDSSGRLLRYVEVSGVDLGESMVPSLHTGVYEGSNDASPARLSDLRTADYDGRECDEPEPFVAPTVDPDRYVAPVPDSYVAPPSDDDSSSRGGSLGSHTGDSGHPCLPGERDGDGDGWCGES